MKDRLLEKFFDENRWEYALEKGVVKGIDKADLRGLTSPEVRLFLYRAIKSGNYEIAPPHMQLIPKDNPGEFRTVYINENVDRIVLSILNDMLFELMPHRIHKTCTSYQKGIGCGKVVQRLSREIQKHNGFKADLSKYFDSVPLVYIDSEFDRIEERYGKSKLIDVLRKYYHTDLCFDVDGNLIEHYQSLKQGCSTASYLADSLLYHIDDKLSKLNGYYVRYSDDIVFIGKDYEKAMDILRGELALMDLKLNPKKVELITPDKWFKFLGFSIKGDLITLSKNRIDAFQKEISSRTIKDRTMTYDKALRSIYKYLYKGDGNYSWASQVLGIINSKQDINRMNNYIMDCLRAVQTGKRNIYGLGYVVDGKEGVIPFNTGKNVGMNRRKTGKLEGCNTLACMRNALLNGRVVYDTMVRMM